MIKEYLSKEIEKRLDSYLEQLTTTEELDNLFEELTSPDYIHSILKEYMKQRINDKAIELVTIKLQKSNPKIDRAVAKEFVKVAAYFKDK